MTDKEAIKQLASLIINSQLFHQDEGDIWEKDIESLKMAISALEKQIPKKPTDVCEPIVRWGICSVCKGELNELGGGPNRIFESQKYCSDCGQAIDWSEEE